MPTSLLAIATKALEDYFFQVPDTEASTFEEPGARKRHAGICAGAVRATGRPTAMADNTDAALEVSQSRVRLGGKLARYLRAGGLSIRVGGGNGRPSESRLRAKLYGQRYSCRTAARFN